MNAIVLLAADDVNVAQNVGFYIIAAAMVWGALRVVTTATAAPTMPAAIT